MTETQTRTWSASPVRVRHAQAAVVSGGGSRLRRAAVRLWVLLHAQALIDGGAGGPGDFARIEDDRRRLAGRQAR